MTATPSLDYSFSNLSEVLNFTKSLEEKNLAYANEHLNPNDFDKAYVGYLQHVCGEIRGMFKDGSSKDTPTRVNEFLSKEIPEGLKEIVSTTAKECYGAVALA